MIRFTDRSSVGAVKETQEGYLVATSRVARTGVQQYLASELGDIATVAGFKPMDVVRVYRHPDEVFHKDSLATITRLPITIDHPKENVTAENWAKLAVGEIGDAYSTEPEWVVVNPMLKDKRGVNAARTTHKEFSMGYTADIIVARDGIQADFEISNIRYNHLALVPAARAGHEARIGDSWGASVIQDSQPGISPNTAGKEGQMSDSLKTVVLGDKAVSVALGDVAAIEQYKTDMNKQLADAKEAKRESDDAKDEEIGALKIKLKKAEDAAVIDVDKLVAERTELVGKVKAIDAKIDPAGKTDAELRKAAVASKFGDAMLKDASDAEISGMFKAIAVDAKTGNPVADALRQGVKTFGDAGAAMEDARVKSDNDMNAWRNK